MPERFNPRLSKIRESRSLLLDYINGMYPSLMAEDLLLDVMLELPEPVGEEYVRRDLGYLRDRGLIERELREHPVEKRKDVYWKMTAQGVTFVERGKPWSDIESL